MRPAPSAVDPSLAFDSYLSDRLSAIRRELPANPPSSMEGWEKRLARVRSGLAGSFGRTPDAPCPLEPESLGEVKRDGYVIEKLTFQSRPGVRVTANLYRPERVSSPVPAVLSVHGHWAWARIDPHVQARCIGLAKLGYVCMAVDAFGAGERAIEPAPGTYHGALDGASLWPSGVHLIGMQVYDNRRAVDYLLTRREVDPKKLAITGASGGGNQSFYSGATDGRFAAVVPVCGVGTYEAYLKAACCVCEVNIDGITYATSGDILALVAPRALLVINATRDAFQFSVGEAAKSIAFARERFRALGVEDKLKHVAIESGHDYNQPMREAMYGFLDKWLRGKGDGGPVPEPEIKTEDPTALRCYPDGASRPKSIITIPEFAWNEGRARLKTLPPAPDHKEQWEADSERMRGKLRDDILRIAPRLNQSTLRGAASDVPNTRRYHLEGDPNFRLLGVEYRPTEKKMTGATILINDKGVVPPDDPTLKALLNSGRSVWSVDLRAIGETKPKTGIIKGITDHNEAEWALWVGKPLLGQWAADAARWVEAIAGTLSKSAPIELIGVGPFGLVALIASIISEPPTSVGLLGGLVSFVGREPWSGVPMGVIAPNVLSVGDIGHLAGLLAPRRLAIAGAVEPSGKTASSERLKECFQFTQAAYSAFEASAAFRLVEMIEVEALLRSLED